MPRGAFELKLTLADLPAALSGSAVCADNHSFGQNGPDGKWFITVFGRGPDAQPMTGLTEWHHGDQGGFQLFANKQNAGHGTLTLIVSAVREHARLTQAGLKPGDVQAADYTTNAGLQDPGVGRVSLIGERVDGLKRSIYAATLLGPTTVYCSATLCRSNIQSRASARAHGPNWDLVLAVFAGLLSTPDFSCTDLAASA